MLKPEIEKALNEQVSLEATASAQYLALASWMESKGFEGTAKFFYNQSEEERMHMLKLFHYINDAGGHAISPSIAAPETNFKNYQSAFERVLKQEQNVSEAINEIVSLAYQIKDHTSHNFMQWYVAEQLEEEALFRSILDKLKIIGNDGGAMYILDKDLKDMAGSAHTLNSQEVQ